MARKFFYAEDEEWERVAKAVWRLNPKMHWGYENGWRSVVEDMKACGRRAASKTTTGTGTGGWEVSIHKVKGGYVLRPFVATYLLEQCVKRR